MAAKFNISMDQGADFYLKLTLTDSLGNLLNLVGYTFAASIKRNMSDNAPIASFTFNILNQSTFTGQVEMKMPLSTVATIPLDAQNFADRTPEQFCYDIKMTDTTPFTQRLLEGEVMISPGVT